MNQFFRILFGLFIFPTAATPVPPVFVEKINQIPDLCQSDPRAGFPEGGQEFCCIAAVSNSLMWLDAHGYPNLVDDQEDPFAMQVALCNRLADSDYMNTDPEHGTGTSNIMRGLKKYIEDRGYVADRLEYRGWRTHPAEMMARSLYPSLEWIREAILDVGSVWLNIGWYQYNSSTDTYQRLSGHWVTVVGFGQDEARQPDPNRLIFHDPSGRTGRSPSNEYVLMHVIQTGTLTGSYSGLPRSAKGFLKTGDGMHVKSPADCGIVDGALVLVPGLPNASRRPDTRPREVPDLLNKVRVHLAGPEKDLSRAQEILLSLMASPSAGLSPSDRCHILVYLGYIEDLQNNRQQARRWFQKAAAMKGSETEGIRQVAQQGIHKPVRWIPHLDEEGAIERYSSRLSNGPTKAADIQIIDQIRSALVLSDSPTELSPKKVLSQSEIQQSFEDLLQCVDRYYSFFIHKQIGWDSLCSQYRQKVAQAATAEQFYDSCVEFVRKLQDAHSWVDNWKRTVDPLDTDAPCLCIRRIARKAVVTGVEPDSEAFQKGIRPGWIIESVNRLPAEQYLQDLEPRLGIFSSERAFLEQGTRMLLCGKRGTMVLAEFRANPESKPKTIALLRVKRYPDYLPEPSFPIQRLKTIWYGKHPSGYGYIRILTFTGRMEIADEFDRALENLRHTKGLLLDIRDNPGGYGICQERIIGRLLTERTPGVISYQRNGPKHNDFEKHPKFLMPCGDWQYTEPVGLLMNPRTGSASDLFAGSLISTGRVITMGQTTHGNSTGNCVYALLPCDLVVRISCGYICNAGGGIIEGNGNRPQVDIEPTLEYARRGIDGVLERAFVELEKQSRRDH